MRRIFAKCTPPGYGEDRHHNQHRLSQASSKPCSRRGSEAPNSAVSSPLSSFLPPTSLTPNTTPVTLTRAIRRRRTMSAAGQTLSPQSSSVFLPENEPNNNSERQFVNVSFQESMNNQKCYEPVTSASNGNEPNSASLLKLSGRRASSESLCRIKIPLSPSSAARVSQRRTSLVGTIETLSPEIAMDATQTAATDGWSFGVFLYELAFGVVPLSEGAFISAGEKPQLPSTLPACSSPSSSSGCIPASSELLLMRLATYYHDNYQRCCSGSNIATTEQGGGVNGVGSGMGGGGPSFGWPADFAMGKEVSSDVWDGPPPLELTRPDGVDGNCTTTLAAPASLTAKDTEMESAGPETIGLFTKLRSRLSSFLDNRTTSKSPRSPKAAASLSPHASSPNINRTTPSRRQSQSPQATATNGSPMASSSLSATLSPHHHPQPLVSSSSFHTSYLGGGDDIDILIPTGLPFPRGRNIPALFRHLLQRLLHPIPHLRMTTEEAIQHPWFLASQAQLHQGGGGVAYSSSPSPMGSFRETSVTQNYPQHQSLPHATKTHSLRGGGGSPMTSVKSFPWDRRRPAPLLAALQKLEANSQLTSPAPSRSASILRCSDGLGGCATTTTQLSSPLLAVETFISTIQKERLLDSSEIAKDPLVFLRAFPPVQ